MADVAKRFPKNVLGEFFVDTTCIDCDTCRQLAPETFEDAGDHSFVYAQPHTIDQRHKALRALLACPTGSIGTRHANNSKEVMADFPLHLEDGVSYTGFNSPKSYGGNSYFVQHSLGNWLIDSPKYFPHLIRRFAELGGIRYIFLTHRDDVAEAHKYAQQFASQRIIHHAEISAQPDAEIVLEGHQSTELSPQFTVIPTPGHTQGHCVLLYKQRYLFTGDHLWWSRGQQRLCASREYCWYSWAEQAKSMVRLRDFAFDWVLPGHGQRINLSRDIMQEELAALVERMQATA
jgi:glyoxylase-like metal-dependent hydrolase (beta-lactamase superfamily II)/ferredoxin